MTARVPSKQAHTRVVPILLNRGSLAERSRTARLACAMECSNLLSIGNSGCCVGLALCVERFDEIAHRCVAGHFSAQGAAHPIADYVEMRISVIAKTILVICPLAADVGCRRKRQGECGWLVHESEIEWRSKVNRKLFLLHGKSTRILQFCLRDFDRHLPLHR